MLIESKQQNIQDVDSVDQSRFYLHFYVNEHDIYILVKMSHALRTELDSIWNANVPCI